MISYASQGYEIFILIYSRTTHIIIIFVVFNRNALVGIGVGYMQEVVQLFVAWDDFVNRIRYGIRACTTRSKRHNSYDNIFSHILFRQLVFVAYLPIVVYLTQLHCLLVELVVIAKPQCLTGFVLGLIYLRSLASLSFSSLYSSLVNHCHFSSRQTQYPSSPVGLQFGAGKSPAGKE